MLTSFSPCGVNTQRQRCIFSPPGENYVNKAFTKYGNIPKMICHRYDRDIPVWNNKTFAMNPMLTKSEKPIQQFRRWFSQFYTKNSPTMEAIKAKKAQSLDW